MKKEMEIIVLWQDGYTRQTQFKRYIIEATEEEIKHHRHLTMARIKATEDGCCQPMIAFDDTSSAWWDVVDRSRSVAIVWTIEDVKMHRPELTDEQCMEVLKYNRDHNPELSYTSYILQDTADELYPLKDGD